MTLNLESVILRIRRADTPFFGAARKAYDFYSTVNLPVPPQFKPLGRMFYELRFLIPVVWRRLKALIYTQPIFCCRCESVGKRLQLTAMPRVNGHTLLYIGNDVRFSGNLTICSGRFTNSPTLRIGSRTFIGHNVTITCNREVVIEDDVLIAGNCKISDYDGHPARAEMRIVGRPPDLADIQPVRICKGAWIGAGVFILKGVMIGEGGIVGANSVVTQNVPPHSVVAGSPAIVVKAAAAPKSP